MNSLQSKIIRAFRKHSDCCTRKNVSHILRRFLMNGYTPESVTYPMVELEVLDAIVHRNSCDESQNDTYFSFAQVIAKY